MAPILHPSPESGIEQVHDNLCGMKSDLVGEQLLVLPGQNEAELETPRAQTSSLPCLANGPLLQGLVTP